MKLTEHEKQTVRKGEPVQFREDDVECVVVRADVFQRLRGVLDESLPSEVVSKLVDQTMNEDDANDPLLESYQCYRR
jgi:hypothetical protein